MTMKALSALTARFNRKLRELFAKQPEKIMAIARAEAAAASVILGEQLHFGSETSKKVGVRAVWGHQPKQKIHFIGIETPIRFKLRMRPTSFAHVTWKLGNEVVRAWIKIEDDGRWVVGDGQIIESNAQL